MPRAKKRYDVCRGCGAPLAFEERIFLDAANRPTIFPACTDCYERAIRTCGVSECTIKRDRFQFVSGIIDIPHSDAVYDGRNIDT